MALSPSSAALRVSVDRVDVVVDRVACREPPVYTFSTSPCPETGVCD